MKSATPSIYAYSDAVSPGLDSTSAGEPFVNSPSGTVAYDNVTITNSQPQSTADPFDQRVMVDSDIYRQYESPDLSNVQWFMPDGTIIPSWIESHPFNNATDTVYWLKIPQSIPADSSIQIEMGFESLPSFNCCYFQ